MDIKVDNGAIEKLVDGNIRTAVAETLTKQSDYLIQRLVDEALKKESRYSNRTVMQGIIDELIKKAANEAGQEWLEEQKPKIKELVRQRLGTKTKGLVASIADQLTAKLGNGFSVEVYFPKDR